MPSILRVHFQICRVNFQEMYYVTCHSYDNETLIIKKFLFTNFHCQLILPFKTVMHWNEFYKENKMIDV